MTLDMVCGISCVGQLVQHVDIGPPAESLYGKKRKGTSSTKGKGKETHDVKSSSDSDSTEDEHHKFVVSKTRGKKIEEGVDIDARVVAPEQRVSSFCVDFVVGYMIGCQ